MINKKICVFTFSLVFCVILLAACGNEDKKLESGSSGVEIPVSTVSPTEDEVTIISTSTPTSTPTPTPSSTPTPRPAYGVTKLSCYERVSSPGNRVLVKDSYTTTWNAGSDIVSIETLASAEEVVPNNNRQYQAMAKEYWESFPNYQDCKIGYKVSFELTSGETISKVVKKPSDTESYFQYIENYLYDDMNHLDGWYSHATDDELLDNSVLTSIKFTAGKEVAQIDGPITLTAFVYYADEDFDENGEYVGNVSYTITINKA